MGRREDWSSCKLVYLSTIIYKSCEWSETKHDIVFVSLKISVMRPPNYTLLMIWIPVLLVAVIVGYMKRENLHVLYETRYWAIAAMVS